MVAVKDSVTAINGLALEYLALDISEPVEVIRWTTRVDYGNAFRVLGVASNPYSAARSLTVLLLGYGPSGYLAWYAPAYSLPPSVPAGQEVYFSYASPEPLDSSRIAFRALVEEPPPLVEDLSIRDVVVTSEGGVTTISGWVVNPHPRILRSVKVAFVLLDGQGNVVEISGANPELEIVTLDEVPPESSVPFSQWAKDGWIAGTQIYLPFVWAVVAG